MSAKKIDYIDLTSPVPSPSSTTWRNRFDNEISNEPLPRKERRSGWLPLSSFLGQNFEVVKTIVRR